MNAFNVSQTINSIDNNRVHPKQNTCFSICCFFVNLGLIETRLKKHYSRLVYFLNGFFFFCLNLFFEFIFLSKLFYFSDKSVDKFTHNLKAQKKKIIGIGVINKNDGTKTFFLINSFNAVKENSGTHQNIFFSRNTHIFNGYVEKYIWIPPKGMIA